MSTLVADNDSDGDMKVAQPREKENCFLEAVKDTSVSSNILTDAEYKNILRKVDWNLLPFTLILYFMSHLDKYNLGQAHARDLDSNLHLHDNQFAKILSVYYPAYLVVHYIVGAFAQKLQTRIFVPIVVMLCGVATLLSGLSRSYITMLLCRLSLGVLEGAVAPCIILLYANWYPTERLATRINLLRMAMPVAGMASALICAGFYTYIRHEGGWQPMFYSEGALTILLALPGFLLVPNFIEQYEHGKDDSTEAKCGTTVLLRFRRCINRSIVSDEQRKTWIKCLVRRAGPLRRATSFTWKQLFRSFYDMKLCLFYLIAISNQVTHSNMINFAPVVIKSLGFRGSSINVMAAGPLALAVLVMSVTAHLSDRFASRGIPLLICSFVTLVGQALLLSNISSACSYTALYLVIAFSYPCNGLLIAWCSSNVGTGYTRNSAITIISVASGAMSLVSANIFPPRDGPRFFKGHLIGFVSIVIATLATATLLILVSRENQRRDRLHPLKDIDPDVLNAAMQYDLLENDGPEQVARYPDGRLPPFTDAEAKAFWHLNHLTDEQFVQLGERHPGFRLHL